MKNSRIELKIGESAIDEIFKQIIKERVRQNVKWGEQNHPIVSSLKEWNNNLPILVEYDICNEERAKFLCNWNSANKTLTWGHIIVEELAEALCAKTVEEQRKELIETAACCIAAIESLDRNGK